MGRRRRIRRRPYRSLAIWLMSVGGLLIVACVPQFFFGIPVSEGFAPAGLTLGPLAVISGIILSFQERPPRGERYVEDGSTFKHLDLPLQ